MKIETKFDKHDKVYFAYETTDGYVAYERGEIYGIEFPTEFDFKHISVKIEYVILHDPVERDSGTDYSHTKVPEEKVFATKKKAANACAGMNNEILQKLERQKAAIAKKISELEEVVKSNS